MRLAAIQLEPVLGNVDANLERVEHLITRAVAEGARIVALPEFFTTGMSFLPELVSAAVPPNGPATELLHGLARRHDIVIGGSLLVRDSDHHVRNAYLLVNADGIAGRHDKDLPTMWENCFYIGGDDDGIIATDDVTVGAAMCWELMRTQTVRRLRGRIDLAMTGSGWWSAPQWRPAPLFRRLEARNTETARHAPASFAAYVGAPVLHAALVGQLHCRMPWLPLEYLGHYEGSTMITAADGTMLAYRHHSQGQGVVTADVTLGKQLPAHSPPSRFWLHPRGTLPSLAWNYQRIHGRRYYRTHIAETAPTKPKPQSTEETASPR
jgi:predicted amidohydrolase